MGKVLTLVSTLGLIIGCGMAFVYLKNIYFISVFPDVIKDPSSLIAVLVVIGVLISWLGMSFFSPYLLLCYLSSVKDYTIRKFFRTKLLFLILNFIFFIYFSILITAFMEWIWITHTQTLTFIIFLYQKLNKFYQHLYFFTNNIITFTNNYIAFTNNNNNNIIWDMESKTKNKNNQIKWKDLKWKDFIRILIESAPLILLILFIYSTTFLTLWFLLPMLDVIDDICQYILLFVYGGWIIDLE